MRSLERLPRKTLAPVERSDAAGGSIENTLERQELFEYQVVAADKSVESLEKTGVALMDMATGLGKTRVSIEVSERLKPQKILFLSDNKTVLKNHEESFSPYLEEYSRGFFIGEDKAGAGADVVFSTRQTMRDYLEEFSPEHFDLIIDDESHHSMAETYEPTLRYFKPKYLLGMTATPDRMDWKDIREIFGPPAVSYTLAEGMRNSWLTKVDYRLVTENVDLEGLKELLMRINGPLSREELNEVIFKKKSLEENLEHLISNVGNRTTAIMCESIDEAEQAAYFLRSRGLLAEAFHSESEDDEALKRFKQGSTQFITAVNMMNEGVDVPELGAVAFLRPTDSKRIFLQQLGRVLRKHPSKEQALVFDYVGSIERLDLINGIMRDIGGKEGERKDKERYFDTTLVGGNNVFTFDQKIVSDIEEVLRRYERRYVSYEDAERNVQELKLTSVKEYQRLPGKFRNQLGLPLRPRVTFGDEFKGWAKFLGLERFIKKYSFEETKRYVDRFKIRTPNIYKLFSHIIEYDKKRLPQPDELSSQEWGALHLADFAPGKEEWKSVQDIKDSIGTVYTNTIFGHRHWADLKTDMYDYDTNRDGLSDYQLTPDDRQAAIKELLDLARGDKRSAFVDEFNEKQWEETHRIDYPEAQSDIVKYMNDFLEGLSRAGLLCREFFAPEIYHQFCEQMLEQVRGEYYGGKTHKGYSFEPTKGPNAKPPPIEAKVLDSARGMRAWNVVGKIDRNYPFGHTRTTYSDYPNYIGVNIWGEYRHREKEGFEYPHFEVSKAELQHVDFKTINQEKAYVPFPEFAKKHNIQFTIKDDKFVVPDKYCFTLEEAYLVLMQQNKMMHKREKGGPLKKPGENMLLVKDRKGNLFSLTISLHSTSADEHRRGKGIQDYVQWRAWFRKVDVERGALATDRLFLPLSK